MPMDIGKLGGRRIVAFGDAADHDVAVGDDATDLMLIDYDHLPISPSRILRAASAAVAVAGMLTTSRVITSRML